MSKLVWDENGKRFYETGISKGVLYLNDKATYDKGVAWNGLTSVSEDPDGAEPTALYADNTKYLNLMSAENFKATIEAYTYPDEFNACQGAVELIPGVLAGQQDHKTFGLSYVTQKGNDTDGSSHAYKIHLVYGAIAKPTQKGYETINDSPSAITFSWEVSTTPVECGEGFKPTATLVIESDKFDAAKIKKLEDVLYGNGSVGPKLPLPAEVISLLKAQ